MTTVVERLRAELGDAVSTRPLDLEAARADLSGHRSATAPLAVVNARSIADVQRVMRIATASSTPVVTRGAGTGLAGGAIAGENEIVLSTLLMNHILDISADNLLAVVEPGVINGDLNTRLAPLGLWFAPDPASRNISTIGGNIATNAGGLLCAKYGVTRDSVLGLRVVLADGRLLTLGHRTVKGVTGLDLTGLMVGSEGTLGVIVEATVALKRTVPGEVCTIAGYFSTVAGAANAAALITAAGIQPAVMELMDASSLAAVRDLLGITTTNAAPEAHLVVQTDGANASEEADAVATVIRAAGGRAERATDEASGEELLRIRRSMHPAMERLGTTLIEDVAVPRSALPDMFAALGEIERRTGLTIPTVAHAGDGNLHPNFVFDGPEVPDAVWRAADDVFRAALALGGTLTGEHGVGLLKKQWLAEELGDDQVELQRNIKSVFDPAGILNPGKVFPGPG